MAAAELAVGAEEMEVLRAVREAREVTEAWTVAMAVAGSCTCTHSHTQTSGCRR